MRKSKFSERQVVGILKEAESGVPVADLLRQHGISRTTFFKWRSKYAGASVADVKRPAGARRRERAAETDVRGHGARECRDQGRARPQTVTPSAKRQAIEVLVDEHQLQAPARLSDGEAVAGSSSTTRSGRTTASAGCRP